MTEEELPDYITKQPEPVAKDDEQEDVTRRRRRAAARAAHNYLEQARCVASLAPA